MGKSTGQLAICPIGKWTNKTLDCATRRLDNGVILVLTNLNAYK